MKQCLHISDWGKNQFLSGFRSIYLTQRNRPKMSSPSANWEASVLLNGEVNERRLLLAVLAPDLQIIASWPSMAAQLCQRGANNSWQRRLLRLCHTVVSTSPHISPVSTLQRLHAHAHGRVFAPVSLPASLALIKRHVTGTNPDDASLLQLHHISEWIFPPETEIKQLKRTAKSGIPFKWSICTCLII